jgi:hypothetical protein
MAQRRVRHHLKTHTNNPAARRMPSKVRRARDTTARMNAAIDELGHEPRDAFIDRVMRHTLEKVEW